MAQFISKRVGPTLLAAFATVYTCPSGRRAHLDCFNFTNGTGSIFSASVSVGAHATGTMLFDGELVNPGLSEERYLAGMSLDAGEHLEAGGTGSPGVVMTIAIREEVLT